MKRFELLYEVFGCGSIEVDAETEGEAAERAVELIKKNIDEIDCNVDIVDVIRADEL